MDLKAKEPVQYNTVLTGLNPSFYICDITYLEGCIEELRIYRGKEAKCL